MKKWRSLLVDMNATIMQALKILDEGAKQIVLVVDQRNVLLGTVTDGDIRRGILKGESLEAPITHVMNKRPIVAQMGDERETMLNLMTTRSLRQIPVIDDRGRLIDIVFLEDYMQSEKKDNWVVLMAGGFGTRLAPLTDHCPKPLLKVGSRPILEIILNSFISYGFARFYISVNYKADMIMEYFGDGSRWGVEIRYLLEDKRLGTAGALSLLSERPDKPFIVMNGDLLTKINFSHALQFHMEEEACATMCVREYEYQVPYGVVKVDQHRLYGIEEKPVQRFFISGGIYILSPDVIESIPENTFYDMPALFEALIEKEQLTSAFPIREYWLDIGRMDDFNRANGEFSEVFE